MRLFSSGIGFIGACLALVLASCGGGEAPEPTPAAEAAIDAGAALDAAIASPLRSADDRARDRWRHPKETLTFFGVEPSMRVVEIWPGSGWYTAILAPYLKAGGGAYVAAQVDPAANERAAAAVAAYRDAFSDASLYGAVEIVTLGAGDIAPENTVDVVLTFRNVHNWLANGDADEKFAAFHRALKPGGVLGVVEHRADEGADEKGGATGYVRESTIKALAAEAGFDFVAAAEINANPADTKDHPYGVWTLPPVRRSSASPGQEDPAFDREKFDAIGESDRMTLKFVKPR